MLIEVKTKVTWIIDSKPKKTTEIYILDKEVFAQAEYAVMTLLNQYQNEGTVESYEIQSLKASPIKEIVTQYTGEHSFVASLKDIAIQNNGTEKVLRYKILLWADSIPAAMNNTREIAAQGYDMLIEGLRQVDYYYLNTQSNEENTVSENQ